MLARLIGLHDRHRLFASLLAMFVAFRALAVAFLQPGGFLIANTPDQFYYFQVAQLAAGGQYPYLDYWMEFPPIFPWLMVAAYKLSLLIPPYGVGILWFNLILRGLMLPFEVGTLALAYATADRIGGREAGLQAAIGFAVLFAPLLVFLGWFDSLVVFFLLLAVFGLTCERPTLAALGIGLGFGVKLFPLAVLPAAVMVFRQPRRLLLLLGIVALCLALVFGPFLIASPAYTLAFFRTLSGRAAWESVWALLEGYRGPGAPGAALCVRLTWQVAAPVAEDYAVFVHLLAPSGSLAAQSDRWPQPPVSAWSPNEPVVTAHGLILPPELPAGVYTLQAGLYGVGGGARLPLHNGADAAALGEVTVEP